MRTDRLAAALGAVLLLVIAGRLAGAHGHAGWEAAQVAGLAGSLLSMVLFILPVRPRKATPPAPMSLRAHELLGWGVLAVALLHGALTLIADRRAVEYVKLTTPIYQWAGLASLLVLVALTALATTAVRRRLWSNHRNFQALHVALSCILVVLVTAHVIATDRYTHGLWGRLLYLALAVGALLALIRARQRAAASAPAPPSHVRSLVFGRHSALLLCIVACSVAMAVALAPHATTVALREPALMRNHGLTESFPHDKHRVVNCIQCHHNYTDGTGLDTCIGCHRSARADLKRGPEARFHEFCFGCHRDPDPRWEHHGPVTGCSDCHAIADGFALTR